MQIFKVQLRLKKAYTENNSISFKPTTLTFAVGRPVRDPFTGEIVSISHHDLVGQQ
jgi:hypothetical protein